MNLELLNSIRNTLFNIQRNRVYNSKSFNLIQASLVHYESYFL